MAQTALWQGDDGSNPTKFDTAANWDTGAVIGAAASTTDSAYFRNSDKSVYTGLNQSAVSASLLDISSTYTGLIGGTSSTVNVPGSGYLQLGVATTNIGDPSTSGTAGSGSRRIKLDYGSTTNVTTVRSSSKSSADSGLAPIRLKGSSTSNKLYVYSGRVDCGMETPLDVYKCSEFSVLGGTAVLSLGSGCVWTTGYQSAGSAILNVGGTTYTQQGGTLELKGSSVIRTLTAKGTTTINARPSAMSISGITRSSTTATATVASTSTLATGDTVYIRGADQAGYNGFKTITVASGTTFTFTCAADDVTPATGTMTGLLAFTTITIPKGGTVHFKDDPREVAVKTLVYEPGAKWTYNAANPNHLIIGTLTPQNAGQLTAG